MKKKVILGFLIVAAMVAAFWGGNSIHKWLDSKKVQPMKFEFSTETKTVTSAKPIIEYNKNYGIGIQYPKTENESLNKVIRADADDIVAGITKELTDYKADSLENRAKVIVDYEAYPLKDHNFLSVIYHIEKKRPQNHEKVLKTETRVYDYKAAKEVTVKEIFKSEFLSVVSGYLKNYFENEEKYKNQHKTKQFSEHIAPKWENFSKISFQSDEIVTMHFDAGVLFDGSMAVDIPIKKVYEVMNINVTGYEPPKSLVDPTKPMVALSFDDGPHAPATRRILDALEKVGGRATFFVLGDRLAESRSSAEVLKRAHDLGCEIGNHTYDHANLKKLDSKDITDQIKKTSDLVKEITGQPTSLVRAPYGAINEFVKATVGGPLINWSIDTLDWKTKDPAKIIPKILNDVHDGDIILMHDIYKTSAEAAEEVIPELVKRGYQLVTVSELMEAREVVMASGKTYSQAYKK